MVVVLHEAEVKEVPAGDGAHGQLWIPADDTERVCGWRWQGDRLRRNGAEVGPPDGEADAFVRAGQVNLAAFWRHLGKPALASAAGDVWVLGASAEERADALQSLQAPDFTLPDLEGQRHCLSDFRGRKVFLASWASW